MRGQRMPLQRGCPTRWPSSSTPRKRATSCCKCTTFTPSTSQILRAFICTIRLSRELGLTEIAIILRGGVLKGQHMKMWKTANQIFYSDGVRASLNKCRTNLLRSTVIRHGRILFMPSDLFDNATLYYTESALLCKRTWKILCFL